MDDDAFAWPKRCGCGRVHGPDDWGCLKWVGLQSDGLDGWLEMRNCQCASTIAVPLAQSPEVSL